MSGPTVVPALFVATSRTWYSALGTKPVTEANTKWVVKSEPTVCAGVDCVKATGPAPVYFESSPYWKNAVVGRPSGLTEPVNPASVAPIDGAPVTTDAGGAVIVAVSLTVELPWFVPTEVIVTATG